MRFCSSMLASIMAHNLRCRPAEMKKTVGGGCWLALSQKVFTT